MGKGRDKRRGKAELDELNELTFRVHAGSMAKLSGSDPPNPSETDAPVNASPKPKPHLRSGGIASPEPESKDAFQALEPKRTSK